MVMQRIGNAFNALVAQGQGQAPQAPTPEQGIQSMVEGLVMAVDYIAANGQNVTNPLHTAYGGVAASPTTNYDARPAVVTEGSTSVSNPEQTVVVPEARSAFSAAAWNTAAQNAMTQAEQSLDAILQQRTNIGDALVSIADQAQLRALGAQQAMQRVQQLVGTLNTTGNMITTVSPAEMYESVRRFASFIELMTPQPAAGAPVVPNAVLEGLRQRLATNQFMAQRIQPVGYQLPVQTAATVVLAQYAIR